MNLKKTTNKAETSEVDIWLRVSDLFEEIRNLPEEDREKKLHQVALDEPNVEKEVRKLLPSLGQIDGFLNESPLSHSISLAGMVATAPQYLNNETVGDFKIKKILGKGGFATVYLAEQTSLDRLVALKVSENTGREAQTMASLEHDNIVKVFSESVETDKNQRLICMQYVPGITLEKLLKELGHTPKELLCGKKILEIVDAQCDSAVVYDAKYFKEREQFAKLDYVEAVLWIGSKIAEALSFAHQRGVLHLDVKPANILLNVFGRPLLTDFNVSKDSKQTGTKGQYGGSLKYMSPEQAGLFTSRDLNAALAKLDARSDTFSLGIVLKELLDLVEVLEKSVKKTIFRATDKNHLMRFATADALGEALENAMEKRTIEKEMPLEDLVLRLARKTPMGALTFFLVAPSVFGSIVDISYNYFQIVNQLSLEQQHTFELLNLIYKPFIYVVLVGYWVWSLNQINKQWKSLQAGTFDRQNIRKLRRQVLRVPLLGVTLTSIGWGISAVLYPAAIHAVAPITLSAFGQFILSFVFSWLVCFSYSFIFHQYLILRLIYPAMWAGREEIRKVASKELSGFSYRMRKIYLFSSLTPLFGAALILGLGAGNRSVEELSTLKVFIVACMAVGIVGVNFVLSYSQKITQILYALTGESEGVERRK